MKNQLKRKSALLFICIVIIGLTGSPVQILGQDGDYRLGAEAQAYFDSMSKFSFPSTANGVFIKTFKNLNVATKVSLGFNYNYHLCIPNLIGGCIYEHDYGTGLTWIFNMDGSIDYTLNLPFSIEFQFPNAVYPGQRIYLKPTFFYEAGGSLEAKQNYTFYSELSGWMDAPFDGLDDFKTGFEQYSDRANLNIEFPVLPLLSSIPVYANLDFDPFSSGGCNFYGIFENLGGSGSLNNIGTNTTRTSYNGEAYLDAAGESQTAWNTGLELFELVANILKTTPGIGSAAGLALDCVREAGSFKLNIDLDGRIYRGDAVYLELSELPYINVPTGPFPDNIWDFNDWDVIMKYRVRAVSLFNYKLGYTVSFDMRGIDPKVLAQQDMIGQPVDDGAASSDWNEDIAHFKISGEVPVIVKDRYFSERKPIAFDGEHVLNGTMLAPTKIDAKMPLSNKNIAAKGIKKYTLNESVKAEFPKPVSKNGQHTIILGKTKDVSAKTIIEKLKSAGIDANTIKGKELNELLTTFGSYATEQDAKLMMNMLKEAFGAESIISATTEKDNVSLQNEGNKQVQSPVKKIEKTQKIK